MSARLKAMGQAKYQTDGRPETSGPGFGVQTHPDTLDEPLRWRKPRRVFVNSMSDLFHPQVPNEFIVKVWVTMALARRHTFQVLTKRPQRMRSLLNDPKFDREVYYGLDAHFASGGPHERDALDLLCTWESGEPWLPNVWLGTSVEDQERAEQRIPPLLDTPAAVRFLSCEPLLGPVTLARWLDYGVCRCPDRALPEPVPWHHGPCPIASNPDADLHWVIVGGESGPGARSMDLAWAHSLVNQCAEAGVATFVKQLGSRPVRNLGYGPERWEVIGKGGDPAEWPERLRVREFPEAVPA